MKFRERLLVRNVLAVVLIFTMFFFLALHFGGHEDSGLLATSGDVVVYSRYEKADFVQYPDLLDYSKATYPVYQPLLSALSRWSPDDPNLPPNFQEKLQHFNYSDMFERAMAEKYRNAEVPFKLYDVPNIEEVSRLWTDAYLDRSLRFQLANVERSDSNRFMYYSISKRGKPRGFKPPQTRTLLTFAQFRRLAMLADRNKFPPNATHYYFTLNSNSHLKGGQLIARLTSSSFISRDLPIFSTEKKNFFVTDVAHNKGIQCRFGMRGVIAAAHYDSGRNMVAMLRGQKRYLLTPPHTCRHLAIINDVKHPSYRHSVVDWSNERDALSSGFDKVDSVDTIVRAGEVLYIPSFWFHYIVSLDFSIQCNTRSGYPPRMQGHRDVRSTDCMGNTATGLSGGAKFPF